MSLHIRLIQFAAVGEVAACIGGIVVYQDDADAASGLQERKERIVLVGFAAVDEGEFRLCLHECGMGVLVEGVGVGCKLIHEGQGVSLCYDGGDVVQDAGDIGSEWEREAEFVEDVRRRTEDVAWES